MQLYGFRRRADGWHHTAYYVYPREHAYEPPAVRAEISGGPYRTLATLRESAGSPAPPPLQRWAGSTMVGPESWRGGREAEGGGLLNRYTAQKLYRGFESLPLRNSRFIDIDS